MDMTLSDEHAAVRALAADSSVRGIVSVSLGLVTKSIKAYGSPAQRHEWLPRLCSGEALGCFALSEPGTGSDAGSLVTRAARRRRLGHQRYEDLHYQRNLGRHRAGLRPHRTGRSSRDHRIRVTTLYEGTSQIQQLVIGRALTGVNAFS